MEFVFAKYAGAWATLNEMEKSPEKSEGASPAVGPDLHLEKLIRGTQDGDESCAAELIARIYPLVIRIVRRNLARREAEEDLVQEILVKVVSNLGRFRSIAPFDHWVSRVAVNACMNRIRAQKTRPEWRYSDLTEAQCDALDAVTAGQSLQPGQELEARDLVNHLLTSLSAEDQVIMRLMEVDGLSVKEVSAQTGWSGTFVRVRAFRARQKLNAKFSKLWRKGEL